MSMWDYCSILPDPNGTPSFSLTQEEEKFLIKQNILLGECVAGKRKVNAAMLSESLVVSTKLYEINFLNSGQIGTSFCEELKEDITPKRARDGLSHISVRIVPVDASNLPPIKVPENSLCITALRILGWKKEVATEIFESWKAESKPRPNCSDRDPSLIDYVISHIHKRMDSFTSCQLAQMNARKEMTEMGLVETYQNEILNPEDEILNGIQDLHYWIADSMYKSYKICVTRLRFLKNYAVMGLKAERRFTEADQRFSRIPDEQHFQDEYESLILGRKAQDNPTAITTNISTASIKPHNMDILELATAINGATPRENSNSLEAGIDEALSRRISSEMQVKDFVWSQQRFPELRPYTYMQKNQG
ncbi:hypothetical protein EYC84_011196 [Monilinia fructicola]|uniref:Uncharacterized protein n=1 Tax=Monilinia fructicola TaxID=38448 RepID=A0A5M9J6Y6_MONFR|nr:hypothetical protein EYC84_011196 [Monilinia fructicola]